MIYVSLAIISIMVIFSLIGIVDKIFFNDTLGYGKEFEKGINTIGSLCISIANNIAMFTNLKNMSKKR